MISIKHTLYLLIISVIGFSNAPLFNCCSRRAPKPVMIASSPAVFPILAGQNQQQKTIANTNTNTNTNTDNAQSHQDDTEAESNGSPASSASDIVNQRY